MLTIRQATEDDSAALAALYSGCREHADWLPPSSRSQVDFESDSEGELVFVCASGDGGRILGFVSIWMPDSFIHHLYVHSAARSQGVGTALLDFLRGRVPFPWRLKCAQANTQATGFYCHRGWTIIDSVPSGEEPYFLFELAAPEEL